MTIYSWDCCDDNRILQQRAYAAPRTQWQQHMWDSSRDSLHNMAPYNYFLNNWGARELCTTSGVGCNTQVTYFLWEPDSFGWCGLGVDFRKNREPSRWSTEYMSLFSWSVMLGRANLFSTVTLPGQEVRKGREGVGAQWCESISM